MRTALLAVLLMPAPAAAAEPTIEERIARVIEARKALAEAQKAADAAQADLAAAWKKIVDQLRDLGVNPGPGPVVPPKPDPVDALAARLLAAFNDDPAPADARREQAKDLAALYQLCAEACADESIETAGALLEKITAAAGRMLKDPPPPGRKKLSDVRKVVNSELGALFPFDGPLADEQRKKAAALFLRIAAALDKF
jgi:hypothetical protein